MVARYEGAIVRVAVAAKGIARTCCEDEAREILNDLGKWLVLGNAGIGTGAGFLEASKHIAKARPRLSKFAGSLGRAAGVVGIVIDVYGLVTAGLDEDYGSMIQSGTSIAGGIWAFWNPWAGAAVVVGSLGAYGIEKYGEYSIANEKAEADKELCEKWKTLLEKAKKDVEKSEPDGLRSLTRLKAVNASTF